MTDAFDYGASRGNLPKHPSCQMFSTTQHSIDEKIRTRKIDRASDSPDILYSKIVKKYHYEIEKVSRRFGFLVELVTNGPT